MIRTTLLAACLAFPVAAAADIEPGNWELTVTTQMSGQDKPVGPLKRTQCLTNADAQDPSRVLGAGGTCQFSNQRESGGSYSFDVACSGALPMSGKGSIRYDSNAFQGDLDLGTAAGFKMQTHVSGARLGPCQS